MPLLFPELRGNPRGRAFVMRNFDRNRDGRVSPREAQAANRAFAGVAGPRRDRFDWDRRGPGVVVVEERVERSGGWDRAAMRGYGFRQTGRGATLNLSADVLFATDSAALRPGAVDRLRPLADYLRDTPGVRVSVDGFTDARGTDAHNQALSERRAASVRDALIGMGADRARFAITGHGERDPRRDQRHGVGDAAEPPRRGDAAGPPRDRVCPLGGRASSPAAEPECGAGSRLALPAPICFRFAPAVPICWA